MSWLLVPTHGLLQWANCTLGADLHSLSCALGVVGLMYSSQGLVCSHRCVHETPKQVKYLKRKGKVSQSIPFIAIKFLEPA